MAFRHIVLFRVHDHVTDPELSTALDELRKLGDTAGAAAWHVELSSDTRKGRMIIEDTTFDSRTSFERLRASDEHGAVAARMAKIADWFIGEYETG